MTAGIHPTAIISPNAELAGDVTVGPYAVIDDQVMIGAGTRIDQVVSGAVSSPLHPTNTMAAATKPVSVRCRRRLVRGSIPRTYRIADASHMGKWSSIPWCPIDCQPCLVMLASQSVQLGLV